jgi:hypothetical protein
MPQRRPRLAERRVLRAERGRLDEPGATWRRLRAKRRFPFRGGLFVAYDFGKPVTGYLTLRLDPDAVEPGLVAFALDEPPGRFSPPAVVVIPVPGAGRWDDVAVRRFRYCLVAASGVVAPPQLRPVAPSRAAALSVTPAVHGVFGLPAPPATVPSIAFEIWSRLDSEAERAPPRAGKPERRRGTRPRDRAAAAEAAQSGSTGSKGTT